MEVLIDAITPPVDLGTKTWLTKRELAQYLGFSPRFVDNYIRPFVAVFQPHAGYRGKILFSREEIDRFIRSREVGINLTIPL
jgi:hypothetical protein